MARRLSRKARCGVGCALALVLAWGIRAQAASDEPVAVDTIAPAESAPIASAGDGRRTLGRLPANFGRGLVGVFHMDNVVPFLVGGGAASGSALLDDNVRNRIKGDHIQSLGWGHGFQSGAGPIWSSAFVVGMFTAGRFAEQGTRFRAMTYDMLDATLVNLAYTEALKLAVGRERPNGQDNKSFPSGHASNAFALAAVAERLYGWRVGIPAYALAGVVGASRIEQDKHWLSDVVAGATLGYIVGRTVVRVNGRASAKPDTKTTLSLSPIVSRGARGLQMSLAF